jgi:hypothetical protein
LDNDATTQFVTVSVMLVFTEPCCTLIVVVPALTSVANPPFIAPLWMVATLVSDELHVAVVVTEDCVLSEYVPVALNWKVGLLAMLSDWFPPWIAMDVSATAVTVTVVEALTVPSVAFTVGAGVDVTATPVITPALSTVKKLLSLLVHVTLLVMSFVLVSL